MKSLDKVYSIYSKNKLVNDSFWALIGSVSSRGLGLLSAVIVARFLGKDIYGEFGMIRNTLISIAIFSTFGLGYTATKFIAEYKNNNKEKLNIFYCYSVLITLVISGLMSIFVFLFSEYISNNIFSAPHLTTSLKFVAIWIVFNALTTNQIGILSGLGKFKEMAKINTVVGIFTFLSSVMLTYFFYLNGALIALLLSQILNWILFKYIINLKFKFTIFQDNFFLKKIITFSLPIALQEAIYSITSWGSMFLLIKLGSYGELGLYTAAMQWSAVILFIPGILRNVVLSHMSEVINDQIQHNKILRQMVLLNLICTLIPFVIIWFFSGFVVSFYGETFTKMESVLNISIFTTIFSSIGNVYLQAYMSKSKNWLMFSFRFFRDAGVIILAYILITKISDFEEAKMLAISNLIMSVFFLIIVYLYYNLKLKKNK